MMEQAGIEWGDQPEIRGMLLRGQVLRVYLPDDPEHPMLRVDLGNIGEVVNGRVLGAPVYYDLIQRSVVCDVLLFGGYRGSVLRLVPVAQMAGWGRNDADPWIPRGTRFSTSGDAAVPTTSEQTTTITPPENLDGDIVLIGFLEGSMNLPIILGGLAHPQAAQAAPAYRFPSPVQGPATERVIRHRGAKVTIDSDGNVTVDATDASSGACDVKGAELPGAGGLITIKANATQTVRIEGGRVEMALPGALANRLVARAQDTTLTPIDAASAPVWHALLDGIATALDGGPGGPIHVLLAAAELVGITGQITSGNANVRTD